VRARRASAVRLIRFEASVHRPRRRPIAVVIGNCQAAAVEQLLSASRPFTEAYDLVSVPAVHRVSARQVPTLKRLLARTRLLIAQPVNNGYRGLGLGLDELKADMPSDARVLTWAPLYWDALFPFAVVVHVNGRAKVRAPLIGHHDLRLLAAAFAERGDKRALEQFDAAAVSGAGVRHVLENCTRRLEARERGCDIQMLEFVRAADVEPRAFHTFNHPSRLVLDELVSRVHEKLDLPYATDAAASAEPLGKMRIPVEAAVLQARSLSGPSQQDWLVRGHTRRRADVLRAHLAWYGDHPDVLAAGIAEHAERLSAFGLMHSPVAG
jgi:hypothetical protein